MYSIPILFVIFKRQDIALESFQKIREIKPSKLYLACDGAREHVEGEKVLVENTRKAILNAIDWTCDVHTLFQNSNLGCSKGVYTAINWLFQNEEEGIIIEDDCVMQNSFFPFVEELLNKYKDDTRIGMIDGANYIKNTPIPDSYAFSRYKSTNGWATWKRAWKQMDIDMEWRNLKYATSIIANMGYKSKDIKYWKYRIKAVDHDYVSAWDWQWYFTLAANNQLAIYPKCSLITNIGFGSGATHTSNKHTPKRYISCEDITFPLQHPKFVVPYQPFEREFYHWNNSIYNNIMKYIPFNIKKKIKQILNH